MLLDANLDSYLGILSGISGLCRTLCLATVLNACPALRFGYHVEADNFVAL